MIDVILPSYVIDEENEKLQDLCLFSMGLPPDCRKIAIDNGGNFGGIALEKWADIYVRTSKPLGYAAAVNLGWRMATADYVVVLNNDLEFKRNWLPPLIEYLNAHHSVAAAASYDFDVPLETVTDHIWSSCFAMRNEVRQELGFFDDEYLNYRYHDQDYWCRAKKAGYRFARIGKSRVNHKESSTYKKMPEKNNEQNEQDIMLARWGVAMAQHYAP